MASTQTYRLKFRSADGRTTAFDHQRVLRVGRGQDNDIVLDSPSVSRRHAELRPTNGGWDLYDVGSTGGTWINGERVANVPLAPTTTARFGAQSDGVEATFTIDLPATSTGALGDQKTEQKTVLLTDQQSTYIDGDDPERPGRPARGLLIRTRDGDKRVDADAAARIGRDVRSDVVADDPAVSREHANVERRKDGWWFVDHSNSGSYIDGEPVKEKRITEQTVVQLGHPTAGYQITLVPVVDVASAQKAIAGKRRRRRFVRVTAVAAVLAVVAGGVAASMWLTDRHQTEQNALSAANLERAKRASVQIVAFGADGVPESTGSGTIISSDGLILTNAHVAKPTAKGLATPGSPDHDAAFYQVALAKDDNTPAAAKYRATTIVSDGYLDLAVVKINANADGTPLSGPLTLPEPVPVGDSNALQTGDRITALGYPALTSDEHVTGPLTVTSGDVSAFKRDYGTNTERFWIDTTERIAHGNSGGASINSAGELIAINTQFRRGQDDEPAASFLVRPIALATDVIRIARAGGDPGYVSPYLDKIQKLPANVKAASSGWDKGESSDCGPALDQNQFNRLNGVHEGDVVHAKFQASGIPNDTPVTVGFLDEQKNVLDTSEIVWIFGESPKCINPPFTVPAGVKRVIAVFLIGYQDDVDVTNGVDFG